MNPVTQLDSTHSLTHSLVKCDNISHKNRFCPTSQQSSALPSSPLANCRFISKVKRLAGASNIYLFIYWKRSSLAHSTPRRIDQTRVHTCTAELENKCSTFQSNQCQCTHDGSGAFVRSFVRWSPWKRKSEGTRQPVKATQLFTMSFIPIRETSFSIGPGPTLNFVCPVNSSTYNSVPCHRSLHEVRLCECPPNPFALTANKINPPGLLLTA